MGDYFLIREPITFRQFLQVQPGDIISYLLKPEDYPTDPFREWKGRVIIINHPSEYTRVEVLEPGYEGEQENVRMLQIVGYEKTVTVSTTNTLDHQQTE